MIPEVSPSLTTWINPLQFYPVFLVPLLLGLVSVIRNVNMLNGEVTGLF